LKVALIYPHQLFRPHPASVGADWHVLVEDPLYFSQYAFHVQKRIFHRTAMKRLAVELAAGGAQVQYVEAHELGTTGDIATWLKQRRTTRVQFVEPWDGWLSKRLRAGLEREGIAFAVLQDPHAFESREAFERLASRKSKVFFTEFYIQQRKRMGVLVDAAGKPLGGKWSFDTDNRKKLPAGVSVPTLERFAECDERREAVHYVAKRFPDAWGESAEFGYATTPEEAELGLKQFLDERLGQFGEYEDAIHGDQAFLFHSVLTPALNTGLLSPQRVVQAALERLDAAPLNSIEGFIRQVIGWREYIKCAYMRLGSEQRRGNFWGHQQSLPAAFYEGTTGIEPVDAVIRRVRRYAYCHHIERLMILGNFMLLCEIHPDAIYRWFMELFIDAYDWVMVPNVYGMSQYADGGRITTKPYISGSSYVRRMSNFKSGSWCAIWDALYWRFVDKHRDFFAKNPRMAVIVSQCERMGKKLDIHREVADRFLQGLHGGLS
jgi:deoxyribodipyrimidine photolyase-related protein